MVSHTAAKPKLDHIVAQRDAALYDKLVRKRVVWIEPKFGEVKQIRDQAETLRHYATQARLSLELQNDIAESKLWFGPHAM